MNFLSAAFLAGLAAIAVPVVLHLIHRQRYPERRFSTLRFFDVTIKHNVIQRRLIDKILLALRVLMLAALLLALARPFWHAKMGARSLALVVVLDNSPSMGRIQADTTLFAAGRDAAAQLLAQLQPGDQAALVLSSPVFVPEFTADRAVIERQLRGREGWPTGVLLNSDQGVVPAMPGLLTDPKALRAAIAAVPAGTPLALTGPGLPAAPELTTTAAAVQGQLQRAALGRTSGNMGAALEQAGRLLANAAAADRVVLVVSDLQQSDWPATAVALPPGVKAVFLPLESGGDPAPNLAVEDVVVGTKSVHFGQSVVCLAKVRNYGTRAPVGTPYLLVEVGGLPQPVKVNLPPVAPGATALVPFVVPAAGRERTLFGTVAVVSPGDPFPDDDAWHFQVPVLPPLRVLCVHAAGTGTAAPAAKSGYFLANALAPRTAGAVSEVFADVEECGVEELQGRELFQYNVVALAGVETLDQAVRAKVRAFVEDGGGLLVFPGAKAAPEEYNGWGFLPARVVEVKTGAFVFVKAVSEDEAFMAELAGRLAGSERGLGAETWLRLEPEAGAAVLAQLSNGAPALIGADHGRGRVVLASAGCHVDAASDWPLRPAFVILVRGLAQYLASAGQTAVLAQQRHVGEGLAMAIPKEMLGGTPGAFAVSFGAGGFKYSPLACFRSENRLLLPPVETAGHYLLSVQPSAVAGVLAQPGLGADPTSLAANHGRAESRFTALTAAQVKALCPGASVEVQTVSQGLAGRVDGWTTGREIWRWLALVALLFIFVESLVAWRSVSGAAD